MKATLLAMMAFSSAAFAAPHSYIVKTNDDSLRLEKSSYKVESLNVSVGSFWVLESDEKLDQEALEEITNNPDVEYIEPNFSYDFQPVNLDSIEKGIESEFSKQWGLKNTGRNTGQFWPLPKKGEDINAEKAWGISRGSKDIVVAVIDTGIDYNHGDLKGNMQVNIAEKNGEPGVDDDGNGYVDDVYGYDFANNDGDPMDGHGHGTHCAGVIGATHKRSGVKGVMGNVKLFGVKFLTDRGSGSTANAIKSVDYAIKRGAHIMSNSWGGGGKSEALKEVIQAAADAGILFVAAAGNSNNDNDKKPSYPASYKVSNVISVGAMDGAGTKASFSSYGKTSVHVFAPGTKILSTVQKGKYKKMSGTSMATPFVSGVLGLLLAQEKNLSNEEIRDRVIRTSVRNPKLNKYTASGRIDAYRLLRNLRN